MKKKPFHITIVELLFGKDEKGLSKLGLARNNDDRVSSALWMIQRTIIPNQEKIEVVKSLVNFFYNYRISDKKLAKEVQKTINSLLSERVEEIE